MSMSVMYVVMLLFMGWTIGKSQGAKILMTGAQIRSHMMEQIAIGEQLVSRGHQVYLGAGSRYDNIKNVEAMGINVLQFHVPPDVRYFAGGGDVDDYTTTIIFDSKDAEDRIRRQMEILPPIVHRDCEYMMEDRSFIDAVRNIHFDIAIVEPFLLGPCSMLLPKYLDIPFVTVSFAYFPWDIRVPALPSFFNFGFHAQKDASKTFRERLDNLWTYVGFHLELPMTHDVRLFEKYIPASSVSSVPRTWRELLLQAQLYIVLMDHLLDNALPVMPNVIRLPGLTARPPKPLPVDLEQLMARADHGVILMSLGSCIKNMPEEMIKKFLDAFSIINQTIIARLNVPAGWNVPANVHLQSWLPQNDILGHPKTKLFITHCGNNGQYEALYHGVPMIGFPMFAEQDKNSQRAVLKGFGLHVNIHDFSSKELVNNIHEILTNEAYAKAIKRASGILHDEPMNAREKAAFWIEHVIKHGGKHLRSEAMDMSMSQFLMFDIIAVVFIVLLFITVPLCFGVYFLFRYFAKLLVSMLYSSNSGPSKNKSKTS